MSSVVYFIGNGGRAIKIGTSTEVGDRFRALQSASADKLEFLGCVAASGKHEREIHKMLANFRLEGEWFADCADVRSLVNDLLRNGVGNIKIPPRPRGSDGNAASTAKPDYSIFSDRLIKLFETHDALDEARSERIRLEKVLADARAGKITPAEARRLADLNVNREATT